MLLNIVLCAGQVCHCRLLMWCRFKTRKGLAALSGAPSLTRRDWLNSTVRQNKCSYPLCPQHWSNNRWHLVTPYTNAGGRDWTELVGQTLCSCCFQQFRGKVSRAPPQAPARRDAKPFSRLQ